MNDLNVDYLAELMQEKLAVERGSHRESYIQGRIYEFSTQNAVTDEEMQTAETIARLRYSQRLFV